MANGEETRGPLDGEALRASFIAWLGFARATSAIEAADVVGNPALFLAGLSDDELTGFVDDEARRALARAAVEDLRYVHRWFRLLLRGRHREALEQGLADLERVTEGFESLLDTEGDLADEEAGGGGRP